MKKTFFLNLLDFKSITYKVASLPGNLKKTGIYQFRQKKIELENFEKKTGIFNIFHILSSKTSIYTH